MRLQKNELTSRSAWTICAFETWLRKLAHQPPPSACATSRQIDIFDDGRGAVFVSSGVWTPQPATLPLDRVMRVKPSPTRHDNLDALAGTWHKQDASDFERATAPFAKVDAALWK